jgi:hypothetical protein
MVDEISRGGDPQRRQEATEITSKDTNLSFTKYTSLSLERQVDACQRNPVDLIATLNV